MIVSKDNERLYLSSWVYNSSRLLTQLAKIVTDNGGTVKPLHPAIISNRTHDNAIREYQEKISKFSELEKTSHYPKRAEAIREYSARLEKLLAVGNEPISVTHTTYIEFTLDGFYYYYQTDDNPFFSFYFRKSIIENNHYSTAGYLQEDKKDWLYDCFLFSTCTDADIIEGANLIYNMLVKSKYESKIDKNKMKKIDF